MRRFRRFRLADWLRDLGRYPLFGRGMGGFRRRFLSGWSARFRSPFRRRRPLRRHRKGAGAVNTPGGRQGRGVRRRRSAGAVLLRILLVAAVLSYLFLRLADLLLIGPLTAVAETEARRRGVDGINKVILGTVGDHLDVNNLMHFVQDKDGRIVAYYVDTRLVNRTGTEAAAAVKDEFRQIAASPIQVPLGALTGIRFLGAMGPKIGVDLIPVGTITADLMQDFESAGVNQTRHRTWVAITAKVRMMLPLTTREVQFSTDVPITDTVIVGQVPTYFGGSMGRVSLPLEEGPAQGKAP